MAVQAQALGVQPLDHESHVNDCLANRCSKSDGYWGGARIGSGMRSRAHRLTAGLPEKQKAHRQGWAKCLNLYGGQSRNRTTDTRIFNPLLYQLS